MNDERLLRLPEVRHITGLSKSFLYAEMARGEFPKPLKFGRRLVAWRESEIQQYVRDRITAALSA